MVEKASVLSWRGSDKYYNPYIGRGEVLFTGELLVELTNRQLKWNLTYVDVGMSALWAARDFNHFGANIQFTLAIFGVHCTNAFVN